MKERKNSTKKKEVREFESAKRERKPFRFMLFKRKEEPLGETLGFPPIAAGAPQLSS